MLAFLCCNFRYEEVSNYPFWNPPNSIFDTKAQIGHFTQVGEVNSLGGLVDFKKLRILVYPISMRESVTFRLRHYDLVTISSMTLSCMES